MARRIPILLISGAAVALAVGLRFLDPLPVAQLRLTVFDMFQRLQPREYVPVPVRVVEIDDESLTRVGQWPWPRTRIAALVERLSGLGAATIAFAVVFAEPDRTTPVIVMRSWPQGPALDRLAADLSALPDHDGILARTLSSASTAPVVLGFSPTRQAGDRMLPVKFGFAFSGTDPTPMLPPHGSAVGNLPVLEAAARGLGSLAIRPDPDGTVRRAALVARVGDRLYPSLGLETLRVAQGASTIVARTSGGTEPDESFFTHVKVGDVVVPTDNQGEIWLHYTGDIPQRTVPAWKVLDAPGPEVLSRIAGHIVLVGVTASGLANGRATPLSPVEMPSSIHAQAVEQMILGSFLIRSEWADGLEMLVVAGLSVVLTCAIVFSRRALPGALFTLAAAGGVWSGSWLAFEREGLLLDPLYPTISIIAVHVLAHGFQFVLNERERRRVRTAFGRYLAPAIVERLAEHPEDLKLGGETRDLTLMFCDIRGFTSLAEGMSAEDLTGIISRFNTPMSQEILDAGGTIDKYMGDAIMAFWNAPVSDTEHAMHACRAALAMKRRLVELQPAWRLEAERERRAFREIRIGIGLNSGPCCVGNLGSEQRFDYSALGDPVNVAARLEQETKTYGVDIVVGEDTRRQAEALAWLEIDNVRVRGRNAAMTIFALLGDEGMADDAGFRDAKARHDRALAAYRGQEWDRAEALFGDCRPGWDGTLDHLYATYLARISLLRRDPPGARWDGVFLQPAT